MSDNITKAREFLKSYLDQNNMALGEHSAVLAMVGFADNFSGGASEEALTQASKVQEDLISENEELKEKLDYTTKKSSEHLKEIEVLKKELATYKESKGVAKETPVSGSQN